MSKNKKMAVKKSFCVTAAGSYLSLVFFGLPLIVTDGYYNITETKSAFFLIISVIFVILVAGHRLLSFFSEKDRKPFSIGCVNELSPVDISFAAFTGFVLLSSALSQYQSDVWLGGNSRYQGAAVIVLYALVYYLVSRNSGGHQKFLIFAVASFSLVCIFGLFNCFDIDLLGFYEGLPQKYKVAYISTVGNINFYSSYLCLIFPLVICGFCQTKERLSVIVYSTALVVGSFGMMITSSESFVLGFVVSMLVIPLFLADDVKKFKKYLFGIVTVVLSSQLFSLIYSLTEKKNIEISSLLSLLLKPYVAVVIIAACIGVYFLLEKNPDAMTVVKRLYTAFFAVGFTGAVVCFILSNTVGLGALDEYLKIDESWGTYRGSIWKQCIEAYGELSFKDKLFGIGPEALQNILQADAEVHGSKILDQAHNEYLQYLLTTGSFGLLSYLALLVSVSAVVIKKLRHNTLAIGAFAALVSYWVQASVNIAQPFTTPIMYLYIAVIGAAAKSIINEDTEKSDEMKKCLNKGG